MMRRYKPQTIRQAKAEYKKSGGTVRLSDSERRRLERQAELDRRAQRIQYREDQKKLQHRRKMEQEQQEREKLCENGIGLATQLAGFNHTQAQMKRGMETFLGISKGVKNRSAAAAAAAATTTTTGQVDRTGTVSAVDYIESNSIIEDGQLSTLTAPEDEVTDADSNKQESPWDDDDLDDGAMCNLIASAESPHESSSATIRIATTTIKHKMETLPNATKSSFNTSFSFSDIDGAYLSALHGFDEHVDGSPSSSCTKEASGTEHSPETANPLVQNSLADLADELVVSNTQILRELT